MKKLYLDTTIPSSYYDTSKQERQILTKEWFHNEAENYELYTSIITIDEIDRLSNELKRENIKNLIIDYNVKVITSSTDSVSLSEKYIKMGAIPKSEPEDALHISIATINNIDFLASWNFKHIVSINPIRKIHEINLQFGYNLIEIGSLELFGGYKYGKL